VTVELCEYLTEDSVCLQYNVMLWIKKIVSENARNVVGVEKSKHFQGENTTAPPPPLPYYHIWHHTETFRRQPPPGISRRPE
jgi:hypothetical protein